MAPKSSKLPYRVGDRVRHKHGAEYEIMIISDLFYSNGCYKLRNLTNGCLDNSCWVMSGVLNRDYEPCSHSIKMLFGRGSAATSPPSANGPVVIRGGLDGD